MDSQAGQHDVPSSTSASQPKKISQEELVKHNTASDCYLLIRGKVYDVTKFISSHPGGQAIVAGCGTDATSLFDTRPMGSGTPHSGRANTMLASYYIGEGE